MKVYIALLRGINVGTHNRVKMADLRSSLEKLGLHNVKTYIQSGNILFESDKGEENLRMQIQSKVEKDFGISSIVVIRTAEELRQCVCQCPFSEQEISEADATSKGECLHVALLPEAPSQDGVDKLLSYTNERERCVILGRRVYLLFHDSIRNSKLGNQLNKIGVPATVRNWKTIKKLLIMTEEL